MKTIIIGKNSNFSDHLINTLKYAAAISSTVNLIVGLLITLKELNFKYYIKKIYPFSYLIAYLRIMRHDFISKIRTFK